MNEPTSPPSPARSDSQQAARSALRPLVLAFAAIAVGFVAAGLYGEARASRIDRETVLMETNSLPSVEHLVAAQTALRHLEAAIAAYVEATDDLARSAASAALEGARADIDRELGHEMATEMYPGELDQVSRVRTALMDLDVRVAHLRREMRRSEATPGALPASDALAGAEAAGTALDGLLMINADQTHAEVGRIAHVRGDSIHLALGLDAVCMAFAVFAALVAFRALERQRAAEVAREAALEARAEELELFAKRVAHDLLGPLSALTLTLSLVRRNRERGTSIDEPLQRAFSCLKRAQRLVSAVLDFARSAASPPVGQRASLREAIDGVIEEVSVEAGEGVEISVEPFERDVVFACAPGILESVLSNLVRNAVKYMGIDGAERRVTLRARPDGESVRVDVQDTGPGLPPELAAHVFEPYVRAAGATVPGLGLGLATVRRFVEAHGGRTGVESTVGEGSTFWFRLPRAARRPAPVAALPALPSGNEVTER